MSARISSAAAYVRKGALRLLTFAVMTALQNNPVTPVVHANPPHGPGQGDSLAPSPGARYNAPRELANPERNQHVDLDIAFADPSRPLDHG